MREESELQFYTKDIALLWNCAKSRIAVFLLYPLCLTRFNSIFVNILPTMHNVILQPS